MNVGLFIDTYYPVIDGVINVVHAYASRLSKKCNVTVFTAEGLNLPPDYDDRFPYKVVRCKAITGRKTDDYSRPLPMFDPKFDKAIRNANLDIMHIHSAYPIGLTAKILSRKLGIPMIGTLHAHFRPDVIQYTGKFFGNMLVKLMMTAYNACIECWAVNNSVGILFQKEYGLKSPVFTMPFSTEHYPLEDKVAACREINETYGLNENDFVLSTVGRIDFQKNEEFLIRALVLLKEKVPDFKMLFVGDGGKKKTLEEMVAQFGLQNNVIFCGVVSDIITTMKIYARTNLLLFPSVADTYGLVKIEAACQQTPTLFVRDTMAACGIKKNVNGFTAPNNEAAYASKIEELYHNPELLKQAGLCAHKDFFSTWDAIVDKVYERYEVIIDRYHQNANSQ